MDINITGNNIDELVKLEKTPTVSSETTLKVFDTIEKADQKEWEAIATEQDMQALSLMSGANDFVEKGHSLKNKETWVNDLTYNNKQLMMKGSGLKEPSEVKDSLDKLAVFRSRVGTGNNTHIPLYHSGFWITLRSISEKELIDLELAISDNEELLGRETNTLIYSNYSVVLVKLVTEFVISKIASTTLAVGDILKLLKHIDIRDIDLLVTGVAKSMYPEGYDDARVCKNVSVLDKNSIPVCNQIMKTKLDITKLTHVDSSRMTDAMLQHMSHRTPGSVSLDDVKSYRTSLNDQNDNSIDINYNSSVISVRLHMSSVESLIATGDLWVRRMTSLVEKSFTDKLSRKIKMDRVSMASKTAYLSQYNHFIKSISIGDVTIDTSDELIDILTDMSSNDVVSKDLVAGINKFIENNTIAIIGVPNYQCDKCNAVQQVDNGGGLSQIIPIKGLTHFFALYTAMISKKETRHL